MSAYNQSFKTIIQSHCSKLTPIASLPDEKINDTVFLFAFSLELPETERNIKTKMDRNQQKPTETVKLAKFSHV